MLTQLNTGSFILAFSFVTKAPLQPFLFLIAHLIIIVSRGQIHTTNNCMSTTTEEVVSSPMEDLLNQHVVEIPEVGDVIPGTVMFVASSYALVDLGPMGTGIVLGKEMRDGLGPEGKLKVGTTVTATLMSYENEDGYIELSIREASYEKSWEDIEHKLTNREVVATKVSEANKGGLMVEINGIVGFLPVSQLASEHYPRVEDGDKNKILDLLKKLIGQEIQVRILDADRETEKLIVSEKAAQSEKERELINLLKVGDIVSGEVSGVVDFGAFVKFTPPVREDGKKPGEKLEGLVHISELAWQLIDDPREMIKTGDTVEAKIIGIEETRISLSMKALKKDPWDEVLEKYKVGDVVSGKCTGGARHEPRFGVGVPARVDRSF